MEPVSADACFASRYPEAREKFLSAARGAGAHLAAYRHDSERGPEGEELFLDVAVVGDRAARRRLVIGSGTHGIEGYPGSAAQTAWLLAGGAKSLPADTGVVLLHGLNPWGFAHRQRVTEENVDLNRNFVDHGAPYPANPGYAKLHRILTPETWDERSVAAIFEGLDAFRAGVGEQAFSDAYNGGQYEFPDGVFYGGQRPQWSNRAFHAALREHVSGASAAALIDLHTGIGGWCEHVFLCFHPEGSPARERARAWWGERAVNRQGSTHKAVAAYQGLLADAFVRALPGAQTTAVVIEFGTRSRAEMQKANLSLRWLRVHGAGNPPLAERVFRDYVEAFYPGDGEWRKAVIAQSAGFIREALAGLGAQPI